MSVKAKIDFSLLLEQSGSSVFGAAPYWTSKMELEQTLKNGTAANLYDLQYAGERTVLTAANDDIDLAGAISDAMGTTITAAELVAVFIINKAKDGTANTTSLTIGGSTAGVPGFTTAVATIPPGGWYMIGGPGAAGLATITAATGDILRVTNGSGASNKYQIAVLARSV